MASLAVLATKRNHSLKRFTNNYFSHHPPYDVTYINNSLPITFLKYILQNLSQNVYIVLLSHSNLLSIFIYLHVQNFILEIT